MSVITSDEISKLDDFYSARSTFSDGALSMDSLAISNEPAELVNQIATLHDKRYDATYQLSQYKFRFSEIEKQELQLMTESTIEHTKLQKGYIYNSDNDDKVKNLAKQAAERLGLMKFELKQIDVQVQDEQEKLRELDEQLERVKNRLNEAGQHDTELQQQSAVLEQQVDQQARVYEDLEFKQLEMQSKFEEESEELKRKIIEAQKQFIMSNRDRENRKVILDEQQILLMKTTRKQLDRLESERNYCNQQVAYFQGVVNNCTAQIERLSRRLDQGHHASEDLLHQMCPASLYLPSTQPRSQSIDGGTCSTDGTFIDESNFHVYSRLADCSSVPLEENGLLEPVRSQHFSGGPTAQDSLDHQLQSLTDIVRLSLCNRDGRPSSCSSNDGNSNGGGQPSLLPSFFQEDLDDTKMTTAANPTVGCTFTLPQPPQKPSTIVTFDCGSVGESISSTQSPPSNDLLKHSRSDIASETSSFDDTNGFKKPSVVRRKREKDDSSRRKQSRPLTCFLPKLHSDFNLRQHVESCGHDLTLCDEKHVQLDASTCQGYLWKLADTKSLFGARSWRKRWFYFDHSNKQLSYYSSQAKSAKIKGSVDFRKITDVFIDHSQRSRRPNRLCFCIETMDRTYHLMASRAELVPLWVDVVFTGAEGYLSLHHPSMLSSITSNGGTS